MYVERELAANRLQCYFELVMNFVFMHSKPVVDPLYGCLRSFVQLIVLGTTGAARTVVSLVMYDLADGLDVG